MVKIRLKRMGKKKKAFYRIVAADARAPRDGKFIEQIGYYDPHSKDLKINKELAFKWLNDGAKPTEIVRKLFKNQKINEEFILQKQKAKK